MQRRNTNPLFCANTHDARRDAFRLARLHQFVVQIALRSPIGPVRKVYRGQTLAWHSWISVSNYMTLGSVST